MHIICWLAFHFTFIGNFPGALVGLDGALEAAMSRVVVEEIDHIVEIDEGIVNRHHIQQILLRGCAQHQAPDSAEAAKRYFAYKLLFKDDNIGIEVILEKRELTHWFPLSVFRP